MATDETTDRPKPVDEPAGAPSPAITAGPVRRAIATLLDMAVFTTLSLLMALPAVRAIDWATALSGVDELTRTVSSPAIVHHFSSVAGLWIALWWCYFTFGWGVLGATPGKWLAGIRVVDYRGRCPIGAARALLRLLAYTVSSATLGAGHAVMFFRSDQRALHDLLAGTVVVRRPRRRASRA